MPTRTLPIDTELTAYSGASLRRAWRWKPDGVHGQDFTGWNAVLLIGPPRGEALLDISSAPGVTLGLDGTIGISLSATQTAALPGTNLMYTLDLVDSAGTVLRFLRGRLVVVKDVERA